MKLEELARQSSDAARASVVHLDPPPIAERRSRWITLGLPAMAGAACLALLVGGFMLASGGSTDDANLAAGPEPAVPRLGLAEPGDWRVSAAADLSDEQLGQRPWFTYLGSGTDDDPFADGDLVIITLPEATAETITAEAGSTVDIRGTTGQASVAEEGLPAGSTLVVWLEPGTVAADGTGLAVGLVSSSFDQDRLVAIAADLEIDPARGRAAVRPPDDLGLELLAEESSGPFGLNGRGGDGWVIGYERSADGEVFESLTVTTTRGDLDSQRSSQLWWGAAVEAVTVDGRPGFRSIIDYGQSDLVVGSTVVWAPEDGIVAFLSHTGSEPGADPDFDVVAVAGSLVELDDDAWASVLDSANDRRLGTDAYDAVYGETSGETPEGVGYQWVIGEKAGDLCFDLQLEEDGSGSCQPPVQTLPEPGTARTIDNMFGQTVTAVVIAASTDVEVVLETNGLAPLERADGDGVVYWIYVGRPDVQPTFTVIVDGEPVGTVEAAAEVPGDGPAAPDGPPSVDVASNPSALALGIADDFELIGSTEEAGDLRWAVGRVGSDLCVVTDGATVGAGCQPAADVIVFKPMQLPDGSDLTFIVMTDPPPCLELGGLSAVTTTTSTAFSDRAATTLVMHASGVAEGWRLLMFEGADEVWIDLPDVEGTTTWPAAAC